MSLIPEEIPRENQTLFNMSVKLRPPQKMDFDFLARFEEHQKILCSLQAILMAIWQERLTMSTGRTSV